MAGTRQDKVVETAAVEVADAPESEERSTAENPLLFGGLFE